MTAYALRRLALAVPLVLGVATVVFLVLVAAPGDPATLMLGPGVSPDAAARLREVYCFDCPLAERYLRWLGALVRGDFGWSFSHGRPVGQVLAAVLPDTLLLSGCALVLSFLVGIVAGVVQAVRHHSLLDRVLSAVSLFFYSVPSFWLAVMLVLVFSYYARNVGQWPIWFPASGARGLDHAALDPAGRLLDTVRHLVLPVTTLTLVLGAGVARYVRNSMLEVGSQDYVRTARAKGLPERTVVLRHSLRNGLIPVVTLLGLHLPVLFSGAVFVEVVFAWPGMGKTMVDAILARDYPLVMAASVLFATMVVAGNLLADLLYSAVDPRVRGGPLLAAALPGLPQLLAGRTGSGGGALLAWLGGVAVALARMDRVLAPGAYGADGWVAVAVLALCLAVPWLWSVRDARLGAFGGDPARRWPVARAFAADRAAVAGLVLVAGAYAVALLAPFLAPYDPIVQGDLLTERLLAPSSAHPLGTDQVGRDVLSRLLYGARVSLLIAFVAVALSVTLGTLLGAVSGYLGRAADAVVMRGVDVVIAFPRLVLLVTVVAFFEPTVTLLVLVLGLTQWPVTTRIVRGEVLSLREREFVQAARALGFSRRRIVLRHLVPNALAPVVVAATLGIGHTIVLEAGLSFLGLGVSAPTPSWGTMIADGRGAFLGAWWLSTFPGLAIVFTVLAVNLVGDGLRDALDPRMEPLP